MLLWEIASHKVPYAGFEDAVDISDMIIKGIRPSLEGLDIPIKYRNIITRGWAADADERPYMKEIYEVLDRLANGIDPLWEEYDTQWNIPEIRMTATFENDTSNADSGFGSDAASVTDKVTRSRASSIEISRLSICTSVAASATSSALPTPTGSISSVSSESFTGSNREDTLDNKDLPKKSNDNDRLPKDSATSLIAEAQSYHKKRQYQQAYDLYCKAAEADEPNGHYALGLYLMSDKYGYKNMDAALTHFAKAADNRVKKAGFMYAYCWKLQHDQLDENALKYLKMSVDAEHKEAMEFYAKILAKGKYGVKKDVVAAEHLLNRLILKGDADEKVKKCAEYLRQKSSTTEDE
jgi:hypothetical protein